MGLSVGLMGPGERTPRPHKPLNDLYLTNLMVEIHAKHQMLEYLTREGREADLFIMLSDLEGLTHKAQIRLNELRWPNDPSLRR